MKCENCNEAVYFPYCHCPNAYEEEKMLNNDKFIFETEVRTNIKRDGIDELLSFLNITDFFEAPASTKYHGAIEHGLVKHSLAVYNNFWKVAPIFGFTHTKENDESAAIVCLFHDICKINYYKKSYKNVKNEDTGKWERVSCYTTDEQLPFGAHGAKSMFLVSKFIKLYDDEAMAILHHMGAWDKGNYSDPGKAYSYSTLAWLLHVADEAATYIDEE